MLSKKSQSPIFETACRLSIYVAVAIALVLFVSGTTWAQDDFKVSYFDNNGSTGAPDTFVHVLNPGVQGAPDPSGQLCADVYIFRADQQLEECCAFLITANGELTLSIGALTSNPSNGVLPISSGMIAIISDPTCTPTAPTPTAGLRAWATHSNFNTVTGLFDVTETEMSDTTLSSAEQADAGSLCTFIFQNQSGAGQCFDPKAGGAARRPKLGVKAKGH